MYEEKRHRISMQPQDKGNASQFKFQLTSQLQDFGGKIRKAAGSLDRPRMQSRVKGCPSLITVLFTNVSIQCVEVEINSAPRFDRDQAGREVSHACPRLFVSLRAERARARGAMVSDVTMTYFRRYVRGVNQEVKQKSKPTAPGRTKSSRPDNRWDGGATIGIARVRGKWKRREKWRGA